MGSSTLVFFFFFKIVSANLSLLNFLMNFRIILSISAKKKGSWNLDSDQVESVDQFREYCHLNDIVFQSDTWDAFPFIQVFFHFLKK